MAERASSNQATFPSLSEPVWNVDSLCRHLSYQLKAAWPLSSDFWHQQGIRAVTHWIFSLFQIGLCKLWRWFFCERPCTSADSEKTQTKNHATFKVTFFFSIFCCAICSSTGYFDHALNCCHMIGWLDICINKQLKRCAFTKIQQIAYASNHEQRHEHNNWSLILYSSQCYAALPSRVHFNTHKSQTCFAFFSAPTLIGEPQLEFAKIHFELVKYDR